METLKGVLECGALLAIGTQLRQSGLLRDSDGQTAIRLGTYLTLPAVIIRSLCTQGPPPVEAWLGVGVALVCSATQGAAGWFHCVNKGKQARERAVLAGCSLGASLALIGLPVGQTLLGPQATQTLVLITLLNSITVRGASYLLLGSAGPAFPEAFKHEDGGVYRGQWRGMRKEGLGVYTYASGARYEGEWKDNLKDGRGVYYYPKGGTYEGEWSGGVMSGVGVRTLSSGEVRAGRWENGQLVTPLELWQCSYAAEGAAETALAARKVEVGGGTQADALTQLLQYAPLWAGLASLCLVAMRQPLPVALDAITGVLAPANAPLMLMAAGVTLKLDQPQPRMMPEVVRLLAARTLIPVVVCTCLLLALPVATAQQLAAIAAVLCAFLAPVQPEVVKYAHSFRLNEGLATAIVGASNMVAVPLLLAFSLAIAFSASSVSTVAGLPMSGAGLGLGMMTPHTTQPLLAFCLVSIAAVLGATAWATRRFGDGSMDTRVLMVYTGQGDQPAPAAAGGSFPNNSSSITGGPPGTDRREGNGRKPGMAAAIGGSHTHSGHSSCISRQGFMWHGRACSSRFTCILRRGVPWVAHGCHGMVQTRHCAQTALAASAVLNTPKVTRAMHAHGRVGLR